MEGESSFTRSIIDELHSTDNQGYQMEGESGVIEVVLSFIEVFLGYPTRSSGR